MIPGYMGHVAQLKAENQIGKTFAKITADCLESRVKQGTTLHPDDRFNTTYNSLYGRNINKKTLIENAKKILDDVKV